MKKTWIKILAAAAVLAIAAAAVAIALDIRANRRGGAVPVENSMLYYFSDTEGATRFLVDSDLLDDRIGGFVDSFMTCDGTVGLARAGTGLYRVDADGVTLLYPAGVERAALSLDCETAVFTTATELHVVVNGGEIEHVKPESAVSIPAIAVSPDGRTVGYTVKTSDGAYTAYAYRNGESSKLADGAYVIAIGDGAGVCWWIDPADSSLWYMAGGKAKKVADNVSSQTEFNRTLTEVMFDIDGVTYYSVKGSKPKALVGGASVFSTQTDRASKQGGDGCMSSVKDCDTIFGSVFYGCRSSSSSDNTRTVYDLWYVDGHRHATALAKGAYQFYINEARTKLSVLIDSAVWSMDIDDPRTAEKICANVYGYNASKDGRIFYCIGYDRGLYYVEDGANPIKIAEGAVYSAMTADGKCLFLSNYDSTGILCLADGRKPLVTVTDNAAHFEVFPKVCCYYTGVYEDEYGNKAYDVYTSKDGAEFTLALSAARLGSNGEE
ncbi:MAG: hypothetical protein J5586_08140 [Clostridia bacterium]|nr:hypothetical protein [Clostridia bacterium]